MADIVLKQTSSGGVIQEMDSSDKDYISHVLLTDFNSSDTGVGTLSVNPGSTSGLTLIGSFVDTKRPDAVGSHPVGTSITTVATFNMYQDLQAASESISIRPLALDGSADIQRMTDSEVNDDFIFDTQQNIYEGGVGSYQLQPSAPSGGTWVEKATITNTLQSGSNTTKLWRKSAPASTPTTVRPLKYVVSSGSIREMTDTEIKQYTPRLRNRIVANGIGTYKFQTSAPTSGGTWIQAGSGQFVDTRHQVANQNYTSTFSNTFTNTFTNTFAGFFSAVYNRFAPFSGSFQGSFAGSRTRFFTGSFTGTFTGFFTGSFTGLTVQSSTEDVSTKKLWVRVA